MATMPTFEEYTPCRAADLNDMAREIEKAGIACKVRISENTPVTNNTETILAWDTSDMDTDGMWDSSSPEVITVRTAGTYMVVAQYRFGANGDGQRVGRIMLNGDNAEDNTESYVKTNASSGDSDDGFQVTAVLPLAQDDQIRSMAWQNSGSDLDLGTGYGGTYLAVTRIAGREEHDNPIGE